MTTSLVLVVCNRLDLTRACLDSLRATLDPFELCVVDNGSTDDTADYFKRASLPYPSSYHRNDDNLGLIRALNQGARLASREFLCFLHNDTIMHDPRWLGALRGAVRGSGRIGLAGLYGARRLRRDGRYVGRTIVHCLEGSAKLRAPMIEVAAVDGVCLFLRRSLLESLGGFDEQYGFFHGYDRDLSFAVRAAGWRCAVVNAPFVHHGGGTRAGPDAPLGAAIDLAQRREALRRFARKWQHRLPSDVRSRAERVRDWLAVTRSTR